ncbi:MAG: hypothetical protein HW416_2839 [Chloroflexi bacterium]|nr:hypothetical protein [Chloroflexota bacterium]
MIAVTWCSSMSSVMSFSACRRPYQADRWRTFTQHSAGSGIVEVAEGVLIGLPASTPATAGRGGITPVVPD